MNRDVVAAAGRRVNIAGDSAVAAPTRAAFWVTRRLRRYLYDRSSGDGLRKAVGFELLMAHPPSLMGGEATAPPCRLDKLAAVTGVSRRVQCDGAGTLRKKASPRVVRLRPMDAAAGKLLMGP